MGREGEERMKKGIKQGRRERGQEGQRASAF